MPGPVGLPVGRCCRRDSTTGAGCNGARAAAAAGLAAAGVAAAELTAVDNAGCDRLRDLGPDRQHVDRHMQTPQLPWLQHPDTDHLARQLLAALVADIEHDAVFAGLGGVLVGDGAIDTERAIAFVGDRLA